MQIDNFYEELIDTFKKECALLNDMNKSTERYDAKAFSDGIDSINHLIRHRESIYNRIATMRAKNIETMRNRLCKHFGISQKKDK